MESNRIIFIDYLKVIGIFCIILAHVCHNMAIMQMRDFDVPLMVVVSGFLAINSYKRVLGKSHPVLNYYWKRLSRLVFPTWIFLTIYLISVFVYCSTSGISFPYSDMEILHGFLLLENFRFVWIIRVYMICALLVPVIYYFDKNIKSAKIKVIILLVMYILYEIFVFLGFNELNVIFKWFIAFAIPYGMIYILGMISKNCDYKFDKKISAIFLVIFVIALICTYLSQGYLLKLGQMKSPPRIYYSSFALFVSFGLISIFKRANLKNYKIIEFISKSSLWIYLWHILFLYFVPVILGEMDWTVEYLIVLGGSIMITYVQNKILDVLNSKNIDNGFLKLFRG